MDRDRHRDRDRGEKRRDDRSTRDRSERDRDRERSDKDRDRSEKDRDRSDRKRSRRSRDRSRERHNVSSKMYYIDFVIKVPEQDNLKIKSNCVTSYLDDPFFNNFRFDLTSTLRPTKLQRYTLFIYSILYYCLLILPSKCCTRIKNGF
jgi:hypothetical protein